MEDAVAQGQAGSVGSGGRHRVDRSGWRRRGCEGGRRGVERASGWATGGEGGRAGRRDAQGRTSGAGSVGRAGHAGDVGVRVCEGAPGSVEPLGPGDGPLVHHPR
jgi:hypothetical protein